MERPLCAPPRSVRQGPCAGLWLCTQAFTAYTPAHAGSGCSADLMRALVCASPPSPSPCCLLAVFQQCRERWFNHLSPDVSRLRFSISPASHRTAAAGRSEDADPLRRRTGVGTWRGSSWVHVPTASAASDVQGLFWGGSGVLKTGMVLYFYIL